MCFVIFVLPYCSPPQKHPVCLDLEDNPRGCSHRHLLSSLHTTAQLLQQAGPMLTCWELPWYGEATPPASYLAYLLSALKPSSSHFKRKVSAFSGWSWTVWKPMSTSTSSTASLFVKWCSEWTDFLRLGPQRNGTDDECKVRPAAPKQLSRRWQQQGELLIPYQEKKKCGLCFLSLPYSAVHPAILPAPCTICFHNLRSSTATCQFMSLGITPVSWNEMCYKRVPQNKFCRFPD